MSKKSKPFIAEQKGPLKPHCESYRTQTHTQKVDDAVKDANMRRSYQHFDKTFEPKR
jgi:hypothetical protein